MIATGNHGDFDSLRGAQPLTQGRLWASPQIAILSHSPGAHKKAVIASAMTASEQKETALDFPFCHSENQGLFLFILII